MGTIISRFKTLESWGTASGEYVAFMSLVFCGVGSVGKEGSNAVGSAWATPVNLKELSIPSPVSSAAPPFFVYSLFNPDDGRAMVWVFKLPTAVFEKGGLNYGRLAILLRTVHEQAFRQFRGEGERIRWDEVYRLGDKLRERLSADRIRYGDSGAVLDIFLKMNDVSEQGV